MAKIAFLAPANNYHTKKWCSYFYGQGYEVHVISLTNDAIPNVSVHCISSSNKSGKNELIKVSYLFTLSKLNRVIDEIKPDIVSVHYATSYGLLAALSKIKKYSLSVWGTDIYAFPKKSIIHREIVKYSLKKATIILSTSKAMANECKYYTDKFIHITPFGVDLNSFCPRSCDDANNDKFVISTIKSLSPEYGIDILLRAIRKVLDSYSIPIRVNIAGNGPSENELKKLSKELEIENCIEWLGFIPQNVVIDKLTHSDIAVIPSYRESFGVSAVEAQACGLPVIITNVEGLKEATSEETSVVVGIGNYEELADAIYYLYKNKNKRLEMGLKARKFVSQRFEYMQCFRIIETILNNF